MASVGVLARLDDPDVPGCGGRGVERFVSLEIPRALSIEFLTLVLSYLV
jgi:hypothetical protein